MNGTASRAHANPIAAFSLRFPCSTLSAVRALHPEDAPVKSRLSLLLFLLLPVTCLAADDLFDTKPSAARALIEQIKKLTPKPVKFVVNTHFHWDHYQGNEAYPSSWPAGVE